MLATISVNGQQFAIAFVYRHGADVGKGYARTSLQIQMSF